MIRLHLRLRLAVFAALVVTLLSSSGCAGRDDMAGGAASPATPAGAYGAQAAPPPAPPPRNAAQIAQAISGGKVTAMVYVERVRGHAVAPKLEALTIWKQVLEGTGLDPMQDLNRVYATSTSTTDESRSVLVAEHKLTLDEAQKAIDVFVKRSDPPGEWIQGSAFPTARVTVKGRKRVVALPTHNLVVILPEGLAQQAAGFAGSGGLHDPAGPEAVVATALQPQKTVKVRLKRFPKIPESLSQATATVELTRDGGAKVDFLAHSNTPEQAKKDAKTMTKRVDKATSVKVSVVRIRFFQPVVFRAEGNQVKADVTVTPSQLDRMLSMAAALSSS